VAPEEGVVGGVPTPLCRGRVGAGAAGGGADARTAGRDGPVPQALRRSDTFPTRRPGVRERRHPRVGHGRALWRSPRRRRIWSIAARNRWQEHIDLVARA
jgi:hypothetical protein